MVARESRCARVLPGLLALLIFGVPAAGWAASDAAEQLARGTWYEGIPYADARALSDADVTRLIEMLDDPDEAAHRSQIVELLGIRGGAGAYEAVAAVAAETPTGEVDGESFRTRVAVVAALGHLAREDDRALADLVAKATSDREQPAWSHRHLRGARLAGLLRRTAMTALATSGRAEANAALLQLREASRGEPAELRQHIDSALELSARVRRDGPDAAFERLPQGEPR